MKDRPNTKRILKWPWLPVLVLVVVNLLVGALIVKHYGMSSDEPTIYEYAANSLENYQRVIHGSPPQIFGIGYLDYYGPAFFIGADVMARIVHRLPVSLASTDVWHFSYFLCFQIALISLYALCRRWMRDWAAFGAVLLFTTQPVLWGHAFINPKDIPYMAAFLASLALGFAMVDKISLREGFPELAKPGNTNPGIFREAFLRPLGGQVVRGFTDPLVLLAGAVIGLTTSIRVLGPYAGIIVVLYALYKCPRRIIGVVIPYGFIAVLVSFLTWPFLWVDPMGNLIISIRSMSDFPWYGKLLFEGKLLMAKQLPRRYLLEMMALQFTEPALILMFAGIAVAIWRFVKTKTVEPIVLLGIWFVVPVAAMVLMGSTLYNGFRQVFFLIPPLFICAGMALDWLYEKVKPVLLRILLLVLLVAPGIYAIVTLHPYEYIYFNALAGGVRGAFGRYDLDYWTTSYREAARYINKAAPRQARVVAYRSIQNLRPYARSGIKVYSSEYVMKVIDQGKLRLDYAVILPRTEEDLALCPNAEPIKTIERGGAVLAVVKLIPKVNNGCP